MFASPLAANLVPHLRDPDWWFTGVLGLIVISLFWSHARNGALALVSLVFPSVRRRREEALRRERRRVELLAAHPDLLVMELVRCVLLLVLFLALVGFYLFFAIVGTALLRAPGIRDAGLYDLGLIAEVSLVIGAALGLCCIYFGTPITPRLQTVMRARAEYENRCRRRQAQESPDSPRPAP